MKSEPNLLENKTTILIAARNKLNWRVLEVTFSMLITTELNRGNKWTVKWKKRWKKKK